LVEEDDDDAMDTSGPGMNGKWVAGAGQYIQRLECL
jgi:hypothetical protein